MAKNALQNLLCKKSEIYEMTWKETNKLLAENFIRQPEQNSPKIEKRLKMTRKRRGLKRNYRHSGDS